MAFRLFLTVWAFLSVLHDPLEKALITLTVLGFFMATGETVFVSLEAWARRRDRLEEERLHKASIAAKQLEEQERRDKAKADAAAKYFDTSVAAQADNGGVAAGA